MTTATIIEKIDHLLEDDNNFTTRTGLRFMTTVMREALELIGEASDSKNSINTRLTNLETALTEFLQLQKQRREKDESERSKWRWVIITPMAGYVLIELLKWVFR
jgi:hypothetical protein